MHIHTTHYDHLFSLFQLAEKRKLDQRIVHGNVGRPWCLGLNLGGEAAGRSAQTGLNYKKTLEGGPLPVRAIGF